MSDVHNAPPPTSPAPSAPPVTEVPVSETPVSSPTPLGSQAPPKPPGQESNKSSHIGRREAIEKAFARAKEGQDEAAKRPAPSRDKPRQEAPSRDKPEPELARPQQHREQGRFARDPSKQQSEPQSQAPQSEQQKAQQQRYQPLDQNAPFRDAPKRWSEQARSDWAGAPESVRGAVYQMAREFKGIYDKHRGDVEVMDTLRPYHELAQKQGTTLERAFTNYYKMEGKLREDLVGGLDVIVQNMGLKHPDGSPVSLRDVAYHIMNMTPEQHRLSAQQNQQTAQSMQMGQLHQVVGKLTKTIEQMQYQQRFSYTRAQVDEFAKTHPRLDELGAAIKQELDLGFSLPVAYARADRLYPSTHAAQTRTQSAQTRRTSISGAPDGGGKATNTRSSDERRKANGEAHPTRREAIAKAMRRVSNGI